MHRNRRLAVDEHGLRRDVLQDEGQLLVSQADVYGRDDGAQPQRRPVGRDALQAVGESDGDAIAAALRRVVSA